MFRAVKFHHQEVKCRIQALWYNIMSKYIGYYDEYIYSEICLNRTPYIPETWTNGK